MIDPYYIELKNFKWAMSLDEIKNLQFSKGGAVDKIEVLINGVPLGEVKQNKDDQDCILLVTGKNKKGEKRVAKNYGVKLLAEEIEPPRENIYKHYFPKGEIVNVGMPVRWKVSEPKGLIVHYTAGWSNKESNAERTLQGGKKNGYTYWSMSESGTIYMDTSAQEMGYHCGTKEHKNHLGIEICNGGKLNFTTRETWFGYRPPDDRIRFSDSISNIERGFYMTYTPEQEKALIELCLWLKKTYSSFSFDNVLGHDEVAPGRKNDPGAALSMTMPEFRALLKQTYGGLT